MPPTTGHGIVYPASSAPPQAWVDFQNLADSVETALDTNELDGGWVDIGGGVVTGTFHYRLHRNVVYVHVDGGATTVTAVVLTLNPSNAIPVGVRPAYQTRSGAYFTAYAGIITVGTDGTITAVQNSGAGRSSVSGIISYPLG